MSIGLLHTASTLSIRPYSFGKARNNYCAGQADIPTLRQLRSDLFLFL
jgi:hypothetical protein